MASSLKGAFNLLTRMHGRSATLTRLYAKTDSPASRTTNIRVTPSNYFRHIAGPEYTTIRGREFVIPSESFETPFPEAPLIKKGDKIVDSVFGNLTVDEVVEMPDLGGAIMGFRIRCE